MATKKMGRPTTEPKPNKLHLRLSDDDLQTLDEYCKHSGKTRPEGARDGIRCLKDKK